MGGASSPQSACFCDAAACGQHLKHTEEADGIEIWKDASDPSLTPTPATTADLS